MPACLICNARDASHIFPKSEKLVKKWIIRISSKKSRKHFGVTFTSIRGINNMQRPFFAIRLQTRLNPVDKNSSANPQPRPFYQLSPFHELHPFCLLRPHLLSYFQGSTSCIVVLVDHVNFRHDLLGPIPPCPVLLLHRV